MNMSLIIGIAVIIIVAAGVGAYYATNSQPAATTTKTATPPTTTTTETSTPITQSTTSASQTTTSPTYTTTEAPTTSSETTSTEPETTTFTKTTSTALSTTLTTTSITATTTSTTTTSTTSTSTTTTTEIGQYINTTGLTVNELLKTFKYIKLSFKYYNATSGENLIDDFSLSQTNVELNSQNAIKVDLVINSTENGNLTFTIWATPDYQHILQISYAGQTFTGPQAEMMGKQILQGLDKALYVTSSAEFTFYVVQGEATLVANGWTVNDFHQTTVTISNHNYEGYYYKVGNVNDANSDVSWAEGKIAKITSTSYYHVYLYLQLKNNDHATIEIAELMPL